MPFVQHFFVCVIFKNHVIYLFWGRKWHILVEVRGQAEGGGSLLPLSGTQGCRQAPYPLSHLTEHLPAGCTGITEVT